MAPSRKRSFFGPQEWHSISKTSCLYIADTENHARRISLKHQVVETIAAGTGKAIIHPLTVVYSETALNSLAGFGESGGPPLDCHG